jgi:predicted dehydrogenase
MGIKLGLVGLGKFGSAFADLFKSHPLVDKIALCDMEPDRVKKFAEDPFFQDKFDPKDAYFSLDDICRSDVDALVVITQHWMHAPQCVQAMEAGKHVYSAVPVISLPSGDEMLEWCDKLVNTSLKTGAYYMLGETSYYRPQTQFCRKMAEAGKFGDFVYAEGEYCHDLDNGSNLRKVMEHRTATNSGKDWAEIVNNYKKNGIFNGPMHYPTHSVAGPVTIMKAHAEKVTAYGWRNRTNDPFFKEWGYEFSNEFALFKMSNGATVRIAETREAAGKLGNSEETFRIMGTLGSYSENVWSEAKREGELKDRYSSKEISYDQMFDKLPPEVEAAFKKAMNKTADNIQDLEFVPAGHGGSHPYLVNEFVDAIANNRMPAINAWEAARYMAMGVMAHKSAQKDGETLNVPDWGDAPSC